MTENQPPPPERPTTIATSANETKAADPEVIPQPVQDALREAGFDTRDADIRRAVSITLTRASAYFGPIPPAEMLAEYDRLRPGLAVQIIQWADEQQQHRRALEKLSTTGAENRMNRGQGFAFVIAITTVIAAVVIALLGPSPMAWLTALGFVAIGIGGPSVATIYARSIAKNAQADKSRPENTP